MSYLLPERWLDCDARAIAKLAPIQWLDWPVTNSAGLQLGIKREDLLHPQLGGNKFYKLHRHLRVALARGHTHILSFGGAWSNHVYALAAAGQALGLRTTGIIRGERPATLSATLQDAEAMGMSLRFISRESYRHKHEPAFLAELQTELGRFYSIPEGAGDLLGAQGCMALGQGLADLWRQDAFDVVCGAVGTGSTLAGLAAGLPQNVTVCGFSVLKGEGQLATDIQRHVERIGVKGADWSLVAGYHAGGYARYPDDLAYFVQQFEAQTGILLDPVYTAKLMWGLACKARDGHWPRGTRIVAVHSGGLQGRRGFGMAVSDGPPLVP